LCVLPDVAKVAGVALMGNSSMSTDHSAELLVSFTVMTFFLAGLVKGVIGMGLPTIAVGLLAAVMTPAQAAALLVIPSFVTNVWQLAAGPNLLPLIKRFSPMMFGIGCGAWLGSGVLVRDTGGSASLALGAALLVYAIVGLSKMKLELPRTWERWLSLPVGVATGIVTGATGVLVIPAVPYLGALRLEKDELVQTLGLSFTVSTIALAVSLYVYDALPASTAGASLLVVVPALAGMRVGQHLRDWVTAETFRLCFFVGLLGLGLDQVLSVVVRWSHAG
jgi:uncharacterized protein